MNVGSVRQFRTARIEVQNVCKWLNPEVLTGVPERLLIPRNQTSGVVASLEGGPGDAVPCFAAYVSRGNNSSLTKLP